MILEPDTGQKPLRALLRFRPGQAAHADGTERNVAENGHMRKEVEALEHHAHLGLSTARLRPRPTSDPVDDDLTAVVLLELVDAADQGRLA